MKRLVSLLLSAVLLISGLAGCGNGGTGDSNAESDSIIVNCPDYYPYNTFTDCNEDYLYFATYKSGNQPDSDKGGVYRVLRQGGEAELLCQNDDERLNLTTVMDNGTEKTVGFIKPIVSLACWNGYVYFTRSGAIFRVACSGGDVEQMVSNEQIREYTQNELAYISRLRIYENELFAMDENFIGFIFDLSESDTLTSWHFADGEKQYDNAPVANRIACHDGKYRLINDRANSAIDIYQDAVFFDYQSNCIGDLFKEWLNLFDFDGNSICYIDLESTCPFGNLSSDSGDFWRNLSHQKAYKLCKLKHYSEDGKFVSQDEYSSLVIYDLAQKSYQTVTLTGKYQPITREVVDVVDGKVYWLTTEDNVSHIACYDTISDELSLVV